VIILDTNVISELMKPNPNPTLLAWLEAQDPSQLATTTVCVAEITYGLARLEPGQRRNRLETSFSQLLAEGLAGRIFGFDLLAAAHYGPVVANRQRLGRPMEGFDGLICAIALANNAQIATRNSTDFANSGLTIFNPWAD
jgi:predicted nucleic acid-binding protein